MVIESRQQENSEMKAWLDTLPIYDDFNTLLFNWPDRFDDLLPGNLWRLFSNYNVFYFQVRSDIVRTRRCTGLQIFSRKLTKNSILVRIEKKFTLRNWYN